MFFSSLERCFLFLPQHSSSRKTFIRSPDCYSYLLALNAPETSQVNVQLKPPHLVLKNSQKKKVSLIVCACVCICDMCVFSSLSYVAFATLSIRKSNP